jgi:hypothetical protein
MEVRADLSPTAIDSPRGPNFRREVYAQSSDKSTVEDMADMVVHRYTIFYFY